MSLLISLLSGAAGGNLFGAILKKLNLGVLWNSVAGILGGGVGSQLLGGSLAGLGEIGSQIGSGFAGGGVVMLIVGIIKKVLGK